MLPKLSGPISAFLVAFAWLSIAWPAAAQPLERLPKLDSALTAHVRLTDAPRQNVIVRVKDGNPAALAATLRGRRVIPLAACTTASGRSLISLTVNQIRALTEHDSVVSI